MSINTDKESKQDTEPKIAIEKYNVTELAEILKSKKRSNDFVNQFMKHSFVIIHNDIKEKQKLLSQTEKDILSFFHNDSLDYKMKCYTGDETGYMKTTKKQAFHTKLTNNKELESQYPFPNEKDYPTLKSNLLNSLKFLEEITNTSFKILYTKAEYFDNNFKLTDLKDKFRAIGSPDDCYSASILSCFHYWNNFGNEKEKDEKDEKEEQQTENENKNMNKNKNGNKSDKEEAKQGKMDEMDDIVEVVNVAPHIDQGFLSIEPFTNVSGLECYDQYIKKWVRVDSRNNNNDIDSSYMNENDLILFCSETLERITNSRYKGTMHKVVATKEEFGCERLSMVYKMRHRNIEKDMKLHFGNDENYAFYQYDKNGNLVKLTFDD